MATPGTVCIATFAFQCLLLQHYVMWSLVIVGALELLTRLVLAAGYCIRSKPIPVSKFVTSAWCAACHASLLLQMTGRHLDAFGTKDWVFIWINRVITIVFTYQLIHFA